MIYKTRSESIELKKMRILNLRMELSERDKRYYYNLRMGYEGEVLFDSMAEKLQCDCLVLNDLLLKVNNSTFQIDSLIITPNSIHLIDIKNYIGDYYYKNNKIYKNPSQEIASPLTQLERSETLLRKWLTEHDFDMPVVSYVIFVNPEFTLYQASPDVPFILPTQNKQYFKQLNSNTTKLTSKHKMLADQLINAHIVESPFSQIPSYEYEKIRKGIYCKDCHSFSLVIDKNFYKCISCNNEEKIESAVLRSVDEFRLLFPERKITTKAIQEWCNFIENSGRIYKILKKNYKTLGKNRWIYFE
ncbi:MULTISPECIES: nuclease-related domain-containing protein [Bacillaceae]|uniref:nuclease-related domain-containing protein n=1 Tax=Bacillaceae TaxID=186817 RepID=UPI00203C0112|nr:nuclease-related domain-containing protein [Caldibacillus thermoamylovorans]MCM3800430.1 NERD domain-containing protein [Caldibacillus thermoamylovorans]